MRQSIKLILYKGKTYIDGSHPIMIQHIRNGKATRRVIHKCKPEDWDSKSSRVKSKVRNASYINNMISESFASAEQRLFKIINGDITPTSFFEDRSEITIGDAFQKELDRLMAISKPSRHEKMQGYMNQLGKFLGTKINHADINWFNRVIDHFKGLGNGPSTIIKKVKTIRSIIAANSEKELSKEIREIRMSAPKTVKQKLTAAELSAIIALDLAKGSTIAVSRDIFVLQVYLRGIRIGDILQAKSSQFDNGRFTYISDKTGKDMSLKLVPQAQSIVDRYLNRYERLFPFYEWSYDSKRSKFDNERTRLKEKEACTTVVNKCLKQIAKMAGIDKPLSTHIARHTFARMAIDKINNPMVTMELLGHSSLAVHQVYLNDLRKDDVLDQAADDVFG